MDSAVTRLTEMQKEFASHTKRLELVVKQVRARADQETDDGQKELLRLIAGAYAELIDTSMSFQSEQLDIIIKEWNTDAAAEGDADADDDGDDGEIVGIEAEDATQILETLNTHKAMLESALTSSTLGETERGELEKFKTQCAASIQLVTDLTLPPPDEEPEAETI